MVSVLVDAEIVRVAEEVDVALAADLAEEVVCYHFYFFLFEVQHQNLILLRSQYNCSIIIWHADRIHKIVDFQFPKNIAIFVDMQKDVGLLADLDYQGD